jgi:uncharacterized protein (TIGR02246 family)
MKSPTSHAKKAPAADETAVRSLYQNLLQSWNLRRAHHFAALFTEDGNRVGFDGSQVNGRAKIASHLNAIFTDHQTAAYVAIVKEVRLLTSGVALLRAAVGMVPAGKTELNPATNAIQSLVAVREDGKWRMALLQNTPVAFHGRPELSGQLTQEMPELL